MAIVARSSMTPWTYGWPRPLTREMTVYICTERLRYKAWLKWTRQGIPMPSSAELRQAAEAIVRACDGHP